MIRPVDRAAIDRAAADCSGRAAADYSGRAAADCSERAAADCSGRAAVHCNGLQFDEPCFSLASPWITVMWAPRSGLQ